MKNGKLRIWLGVFLLLAQLVSLSMVDTCGMVLWDTDAVVDDDAYAPEVSETLDTVIFGMYVGYHKMEKSLLEELPEELGIIEDNDTRTQYENWESLQNTTVNSVRAKYNYSNIEEISMDIRQELYARNSHDFLDTYDFFVVIGFLLIGILGLILIISGIIAQGKWNRTFAPDYYVDALVGFPSASFRVPAIILCALCAMIPVLSTFNIMNIACAFPAMLLVFFFLIPYGKKPSALPAGAMVAWSISYLLRIWNATVSLFLYADSDYMLLYYACFILAGAICAALFFIAGIKLYSHGNKDNVKAIVLWGGIIALTSSLFGPILYGIEVFDTYIVSINWTEIIFTIMLVSYVWFIFPEVPLYEGTEELERPCPSCGVPVGAGRTHCARCGTLVAVAEAAPAPEPAPVPASAPAPMPAPAPAPESARFCSRCGYRLEPGQLFCSHCGQKIS